MHFEPLSAVFSGVADLRKRFDAAKKRRLGGQGALLFGDEIHRFNRAQQDGFLPFVEDGTITLIGATTENPSFELIGALLSRCRVFVLKGLGKQDLEKIIARSLADKINGIGKYKKNIKEDGEELLLRLSGGDARVMLNALEIAAEQYTNKSI